MAKLSGLTQSRPFFNSQKVTFEGDKVGKMASWQNGKLTKWQVDKMASWQNDKMEC